VTATDADAALNGRVLYFLSRDAHGAFGVDEHSGLISTSAPLDREKRPAYSFLVIAVDLSPASPRNASAQVHARTHTHAHTHTHTHTHTHAHTHTHPHACMPATIDR